MGTDLIRESFHNVRHHRNERLAYFYEGLANSSYAELDPDKPVAAEVFDVAPNDIITEMLKTRLHTINPRNVLKCGFGDGRESLSEKYETLSQLEGREDIVFSLESVDNESDTFTFSVGLTSGLVISRMSISARMGGLLVKHMLYSRDGQPIHRLEVEPEYFESASVWFPRKWVLTSFSSQKGENEKEIFKTTNIVETIEFNITGAREICEMRLKSEPDLPLVHHALDGRRTGSRVHTFLMEDGVGTLSDQELSSSTGKVEK